MNILILEDRGSVSYYMVETLKQEHIVFDAYNVNDANSYLGKEQIDCLIVDLNMSPDGLTQEEVVKTQGGILTGWIWLSNYVYKDRSDMKQKTIIYTEYMYALREAINKGVINEDELKGIYLVSKKGSASPAEKLLECLREISEKR